MLKRWKTVNGRNALKAEPPLVVTAFWDFSAKEPSL